MLKYLASQTDKNQQLTVLAILWHNRKMGFCVKLKQYLKYFLCSVIHCFFYLILNILLTVLTILSQELNVNKQVSESAFYHLPSQPDFPNIFQCFLFLNMIQYKKVDPQVYDDSHIKSLCIGIRQSHPRTCMQRYVVA